MVNGSVSNSVRAVSLCRLVPARITWKYLGTSRLCRESQMGVWFFTQFEEVMTVML